MKATKRITSMILSVCMLLGLVFVPTQAQQTSANGGGFRGNAYNSGVTTAKTPTTAEGSGLLWAQKSGNYAGPPMYANGAIYTYWENKIYKLNKNSGAVEATGTIALDPNNMWAQAFGYTYFPVTYGDGKVYVAIAGGKVQAFDADTLEDAWTYTNADADSATDAYSPITYEDGKIYIGFYKGWGSSAPTAFTCISTNDGKEVWSTTEDGSFEWDGAAVIGDYVVYGNQSGSLISRNKNTGELAQTQSVSSTQVKASVTYDNGKIYTITGDAKLTVADFDLSSGKFSNLKQIDCSQYGPGSTSTPVVYNGIAYVGVGKYGSGKVVAVDTVGEKVLWSIDEPSYPQGSIVLSNAYESDGYLYLYVTYNGRPGGINVIKVKADGSEAEGYELFNAAGYENYCMSSIVVDEEGTLYYKNDSGNVFAVANADKLDDKAKVAEVEKTIADLPEKTKITLEDEAAIKAAREGYESLTERQKALVSADAVQNLEAAEAKISVLKTEKVLEKLPAAEKITLENEQEVVEARKQYDALTRSQKKELSSENVWNLFDAEKKITQLKDEAAKEASEKDKEAAAKVEEQIEAIGTVTLEKVEQVKTVKAEYDKLTKEQKNLISVEAVVKLREAIAASDKCIADAAKDETEKEALQAAAKVEEQIEAIGTVTLEKVEQVKAVKAEYDKLTKEQKNLISVEAVVKLREAIAASDKCIADAAKDKAEKEALQAAAKVEKQIEAIGTVTLAKVEQVKAVKAEYDKLTKEQKNLISVEAVVTLREAVTESNRYIKDTKTNAYYKVTNSTVSYIKPIVKKASVVIPEQITVSGHTYKVTAISAKAFSKNTVIRKVVISKNISKIGKRAFYGCKNLKKIQVKSRRLSARRVGSKAFKGINRNAKMSVPKSKVKSYTKWIKTKGSRSITITK